MPVTIKVNGVVNSLVHQGSNGISTATIPDICKTPSPGGPVPMPYPNISQTNTLTQGTTTVSADGGMMIANKGSQFSLSNGDEPGVALGVKSNTIMQESTWILYSFDVKLEGQGACRFTDKKFQNHENTVDLAGELQQIVAVAIKDFETIVCACDKKVNDETDKSRETCRSLGDAKHSCCDEAIKNHQNKHLGPEKGYDKNGKVIGPPPPRKKMPTESFRDYYTRIGGTTWPDASVNVDGKPAKLIEFKFSCPEGVGVKKPGEEPFSAGATDTSWTPGNKKRGKKGQFERYSDLSEKLDIDVDDQPPHRINNTDC